MPLDKNIIECELAYTKCFSEFYENETIIRFQDRQLYDMYDHNCTYIKPGFDDNELKAIIEDEIMLRLSGECKFCDIIIHSPVSRCLLSKLDHKPDVATIGYYLFDISRFSSLKSLAGCAVDQVNNQEMIQDILYCDLQHDQESLGIDFCIRRCYRRAQVYLSDQGVNSFVCYHKGDVMGICDLFTYKGVAKIEDFAVIPAHQRKGYGTSILKELIRIAIKSKTHTIYLLADENDTAKVMYQKLGFTRIGKRTDLFFEL